VLVLFVFTTTQKYKLLYMTFAFRLYMTSKPNNFVVGDSIPLEEFIVMGPRSKVFRDTKYFGDDYIPVDYLKKYRSGQIQKISDNMQWLLEDDPTSGGMENNIFVYGPPSTGKTHVVKALCHQYTSKIMEMANRLGATVTRHVVYIRASNVTPAGIIYLLAQYFNDGIPRRGISTDEMVERTMDSIRGHRVCIILDEFDKVSRTKQHQNPVDYIIRKCIDLSSEPDVSLSLVIVANDYSTLASINEATDSRFLPVREPFPKYDAQEIGDILWDRCVRGFVEGVIDEGDVNRFASDIYNTGRDIRTGLKVFMECGRQAERNGRSTITWDDLERSLDHVERNRLSNTICKLDNASFLIYYAMALACRTNMQNDEKPHGFATSGELQQIYGQLCRKYTFKQLTWHHIAYYVLPSLEQMGLFMHHPGHRGQPSRYEVDDKLLDNIVAIAQDEIKRRRRGWV